MLKRLTLAGNANVGVFARTSNETTLVPFDATAKETAAFAEALGTDVRRLSVGGTRLLGSLLAINHNGIVVADILSDRELQSLKETDLPVCVLEHHVNAAGNALLVNDKGGLFGPDYPKDVVSAMADALAVELVPGVLAGRRTVGMAGVATNRGALVHPQSTDEEQAVAKDALKVPVMVGTINHGAGLIGAGLVANDEGAAIGERTTGIEIGRIDEALGFLD